MNLRRFIEINRIRPADAIIVRKEKLGLFDHYVIFLGYENVSGEPKFIANYTDGVRILQVHVLFGFLQTYKPVSIRRFRGSEEERNYAIQRALSDLRTKSAGAYHLIKNNCEHFATWVQSGVRESQQVRDFGKATAIGGIGLAAIGIASKNDKMVFGGLLLTLLGGITTAMSDD